MKNHDKYKTNFTLPKGQIDVILLFLILTNQTTHPYNRCLPYAHGLPDWGSGIIPNKFRPMVNYTLNLALQLSAEGFGVFNWDGSKSNFMDCLKQQKCIGKQEIDLKKDFNNFKKY